MSRDVLSDDEDMEADAESVLKEELRRYVLPPCWNAGLQRLLCLLAVLASLTKKMSMRSLRREGTRKRRGGGGRSASAGRGRESFVTRAYYLLLGKEGTGFRGGYTLKAFLFLQLFQSHHVRRDSYICSRTPCIAIASLSPYKSPLFAAITTMSHRYIITLNIHSCNITIVTYVYT
jgi:hypothetical protein